MKKQLYFLLLGLALSLTAVAQNLFSSSIDKAPGQVAQRMAALAIGKPLPAKIEVDSTRLEAYVGVYEGPFMDNPNATFTGTREGDQLFEELKGGKKLAILPQTEKKFVFRDLNAQLEFIRDPSGKVVKRTLTFGEQTTEAQKIK